MRRAKSKTPKPSGPKRQKRLRVSAAAEVSGGNIFDQAFDEFRIPLLRYLYMLLGDLGLTEDVAQESFLRLNQELVSDRPVHDVKAWLYRTGHNLAIDHLRRLSRELQLNDDIPETIDKAPLSTQTLLEQERWKAVTSAMSLLSIQQRSCLRLRYEGMRYRDISAILDITEGSVSEHIRRGLTRLRRELEKNNLT